MSTLVQVTRRALARALARAARVARRTARRVLPWTARTACAITLLALTTSVWASGVALRYAARYSVRYAVRYGARLDRWTGRWAVRGVARLTLMLVNRVRETADVLRVVVPHLMSLMSSHRADHPSTLPRLLLAAIPVLAVPVTVLAVAVGMLASEPPHRSDTAALVAAQASAQTSAQDRDGQASRSAHRAEASAGVRYGVAAEGVPAIARETLNARTYHTSDLQAAHDAKVARREARALARAQARREARAQARREAAAKAAAEAARIAEAKAKARQERQERREAETLAAAQAAADVATADSLATVEPGTLRAQVLTAMLDYGFAADQWTYLDRLIMRESSWNPQAQNASSGAYGLPQSLPGSKMASAGADWRTNPITQVRWMFAYIASRYGTPAAALAHSDATGWY